MKTHPLSRRPGRSLPALFAAATLLAAGSAPALPIVVGAGGPSPFQVDPLYFIAPTPANPAPYGLVGPGNGVDYDVQPGDYAVSACGVGGGCALSISLGLATPVHQNPQYPGQSLNLQTTQGAPTSAVPFVGDSTWTVTNTSATALRGLSLLFTSVDFLGGYPRVDVALDQNFYTVVRLSDGVSDAFYGALPIGNLAPGQSKQVVVRYIVAGNLLDVGGTLIMPPFGVAGLVVPEPATTLLVGIGIVALAVSRRRRCG